MVCSDGVTDVLSDSDIARIALESRIASDLVQRLLDVVRERHGRDNATAVAVWWET